MDYTIPCSYSMRLIGKLKSLDHKNALDFSLIDKAIYFAKRYHGDQKRKSGEPFYSHPLEVAYMVSDYNLKTNLIVASILHDIIEDTKVTVGMILDNFGWRIAEMVDRLTRDRPDGTKLSIEDMLKNAYTNDDMEVILIKLMDRIHNLHTINFKPNEKIVKTIKCSLNNFTSICLLFDDINIEQAFIDCFSNKKRNLFFTPHVSARQVLSRALQNA